jgi:hypothetical protein
MVSTCVTLIENTPVPGILTTQTGAVGTYSITMNPGIQRHLWHLRRSKRIQRVDDTIPAIANGAMIVHNFTLDKIMPGNISGKVTDMATGAPIPGATVFVGPISSPTLAAHADAGRSYVLHFE